jgi:hypothetical protein
MMQYLTIYPKNSMFFTLAFFYVIAIAVVMPSPTPLPALQA